jgi:hypothetical protein
MPKRSGSFSDGSSVGSDPSCGPGCAAIGIEGIEKAAKLGLCKAEQIEVEIARLPICAQGVMR